MVLALKGTWSVTVLHRDQRRTRRWSSSPGRRSDSPTCRIRDGGSILRQETEAGQRTGEVEQPLEHVSPPLVADTQAAAAEQSGERALDHPAVPSQPLAGVDSTSRNPRRYGASAQCTAYCRGIVGLISVEFGWPFARSSRSSPWPDDRGNGVDQREQLRRVVGVGRGEADRQRDAISIHHEVVLRACLAAVDRVRPRLLTPLFARTLTLSTLARDQSIAASSPSQLSSLVCNRSQTPASCQSRSRRQHVVPLPQPSSFGRCRQGQPVRSTKMMPPRAA